VIGLGGRLNVFGLLLAVLGLLLHTSLLVALLASRGSRSSLLDNLRLGSGGGHLGLLVHDGVAHVDSEWRCARGVTGVCATEERRSRN
jgi:hypothetical protein